MTLKDTWVDGEVFTTAQVNAVATQVNTNTTAISGKQPSDADLTAIAALTPADNDFVQRKSGAWTNRTVLQAKSDLGVTISVKDYGAKGDGTTDDTTSIQAALDAVNTAGGGTVNFPVGIYKITAALVLHDHVSLVGTGCPFGTTGSARIRQVTAGAHGLYMETTTVAVGALEIRNLVIESTATTGSNAHGIYLKNNSVVAYHPPFVSISFRDLFITGFKGYGLNVESLIASVLDKVTSQENGGGFFINGDAYSTGFSSVNTSLTFTACYANGNTGIGYNITRSTYLSFNGCAADSNGNQYVVDHCNSIVFLGCGEEYAQAATPPTGNGWTISGGSTGITLISCATLYNQHWSLYITGTSYAITVIGFLDNDQGANAVHGLKIDAGSKMTDLSNIFSSRDVPSGSVNTVDDGAGGSAFSGAAFFGSTMFIEGDLTLDNNLHLPAYNALFAGSNRTWEIGSFGGANYMGVESASATNGPDIYVAGTDTNINLGLTPKGTGRVQVGGVNVPTLTSTDTFTNKRVTRRIGTTTSSATPSINCNTVDDYHLTAMSAAITGITITGTPTDGQELLLRFKDNGTGRAITHGSSFVAGPAALITTTVATKTHVEIFRYDAVATKWACISSDVNGY